MIPRSAQSRRIRYRMSWAAAKLACRPAGEPVAFQADRGTVVVVVATWQLACVLAVGTGWALGACTQAPSEPNPAPVSRRQARQSLHERVGHNVANVPSMPRVRIRVPAFVVPSNITDPPAVFIFAPERPVDHPLTASVLLQPVAARRSPVSCGLVGVAVHADHRTVTSGSADLQRTECEQADRRGVIVDRRVTATAGDFHCVSLWSWDQPGPIPRKWKKVADAVEQSCRDLAVAD